MVFSSRSRGASVKLNRRRGVSHASNYKIQHVLQVLILMTLLAAFGCMFFWVLPSSSKNPKSGILRRSKRVLPNADNVHNSLALDIISSLQCEQLQNVHKKNNLDDNLEDDEDTNNPNNNNNNKKNHPRRLEQITDDFENPNQPNNNNNNNWKILDDDFAGNQDFSTLSVNAKHLLCLAAASPNLPSYVSKDAFRCNVEDKRQAILDIWASARTQMSLPLLEKTLEMAQETTTTIMDNISLTLWMPSQDQSLEFLTNIFKEDACAIRNLPLDYNNPKSSNSLFVDVGSGLGLTTLAVAKLYPNTPILSIEPAAPSWLLQKLNLVCNLEDNKIHPILAGVGSSTTSTDTIGMAKLLWRPSQTRLTRTWTSPNETQAEDVELIVKLVSLRSLVAEFTADHEDIHPWNTKILNLDCEGCEYNVVPTMSEQEFLSYTNIIGTTGVHWGYIPVDKLPSSRRAEQTHQRLCQHYDYARQCIECCAFPQLATVQLDGTTKMTVQQASGDLCLGFDAFAQDKLLFASNDDYGWTELSSMSQVA